MEKKSQGVVTVYRYDPATDAEPRFETYQDVPFEGMMVLDVLKYIYRHRDPSLAFRESCRGGSCAICSLTVNGKSGLSCQTLATAEMRIEPLSHRQVIKDLIVELQVGRR